MMPRMYRVFTNLLGNAIKFSPENSSIAIAITPIGETVRATVSDQGCGIPPEFHHKIFEKFEQVGTHQEEQHSSGLGLTFCKLAVETHGGCIGIESPSLPRKALPPPSPEDSNAIGMGSTFWFTLPIKAAPLNPSPKDVPIL